MNKGVGYILIPMAASVVVVVVQSIEDEDAQDAAHLKKSSVVPSTALTHHLIDWSNGSHMLRCDLENSAITSTATTWYHLLLLYRLKATASP